MIKKKCMSCNRIGKVEHKDGYLYNKCPNCGKVMRVEKVTPEWLKENDESEKDGSEKDESDGDE